MTETQGQRGVSRSSVSTVLLVVAGAAVCGPGALRAQTPPAQQVDSLRQEIRALRAQLDSLRARIERGFAPSATPEQGAKEEDPLASLRAAAAAAAGISEAAIDTVQSPSAEQQFTSHQRSLQALNPEISLTGDVFGQVDSRAGDQENFFPREFELSIISSLDPYSRAKVFIAHHQHGGELEPFEEPGHAEEEGEVDVEEGYAQWVGLPGGLSLTVGKFRQRLGTLNRWHAHALPFQSLPLPLTVFAGQEGLAQTGASVYWLLPVHGHGTYELWVEPTRSSNETLFGSSAGMSVLGHANAFWQLTPATYVELGASGIFGRHEAEDQAYDQRLWATEATLNWRPPARSLYRELTLRGGLMVLDPGPGRTADGARARAMGAWSMLDYLFAQNWRVGARYDWVENPDDATQTAWLAAPTLTWWQSEFVRLRAEYDILGRPDGTDRKLLLQVTFAMGPHKHETY